MKKIVKIPQEKIDTIFSHSTSQMQAWDELHALLYGSNQRRVILEFSRGTRDLVEYIHEKFRELDLRCHPEVIAGGLWLNHGWALDLTLPAWCASPGTTRVGVIKWDLQEFLKSIAHDKSLFLDAFYAMVRLMVDAPSDQTINPTRVYISTTAWNEIFFAMSDDEHGNLAFGMSLMNSGPAALNLMPDDEIWLGEGWNCDNG